MNCPQCAPFIAEQKQSLVELSLQNSEQVCRNQNLYAEHQRRIEELQRQHAQLYGKLSNEWKEEKLEHEEMQALWRTNLTKLLNENQKYKTDLAALEQERQLLRSELKNARSSATEAEKGMIVELMQQNVLNLHFPLYVFGQIDDKLLLSTQKCACLAKRPPKVGSAKDGKIRVHNFALVKHDHSRALVGSARSYSFSEWPSNAPSVYVAILKDHRGTLDVQVPIPKIPALAPPSQLSAQLAACQMEAASAKAKYEADLKAAQESLASAEAQITELKRDLEWLRNVDAGTESEKEEPKRRKTDVGTGEKQKEVVRDRLDHPSGDYCRVPSCGSKKSCYWRPNNSGFPEYGTRICDRCYRHYRQLQQGKPTKPLVRHPQGRQCSVQGCGAETSSQWRKNPTGEGEICNICWHTWRKNK